MLGVNDRLDPDEMPVIDGNSWEITRRKLNVEAENGGEREVEKA